MEILSLLPEISVSPLKTKTLFWSSRVIGGISIVKQGYPIYRLSQLDLNALRLGYDNNIAFRNHYSADSDFA